MASLTELNVFSTSLEIQGCPDLVKEAMNESSPPDGYSWSFIKKGESTLGCVLKKADPQSIFIKNLSFQRTELFREWLLLQKRDTLCIDEAAYWRFAKTHRLMAGLEYLHFTHESVSDFLSFQVKLPQPDVMYEIVTTCYTDPTVLQKEASDKMIVIAPKEKVASELPLKRSLNIAHKKVRKYRGSKGIPKMYEVDYIESHTGTNETDLVFVTYWKDYVKATLQNYNDMKHTISFANYAKKNGLEQFIPDLVE